ncbi:MAG: HAMP domain-containing sensor histidine kinase [Pseudomonadota bacterium]
MISRLRSLMRVTAIRLSILYTLIFGLLSVGIVAYMTGATVKLVQNQYQASIDQEIVGLSRIYNRRGLNYLIRTLERRSRAPGANLYVVANQQGEILAGNVPRLQNGIMDKVGWTGRPFRYERYDDDDDDEHGHRAVARVLQVPNGMRILVGRDIGEHEGFRKVVTRSLNIAILTMVGLGILTWFFVGRRALIRIDQVAKSTKRIMAGDRSERLPVTGSHDEFDRLSENLNHMLDRINSLDQGVKQISDNIAHDLKTPITRLRNKADEALAMKPGSEARHEAIEDIIENCNEIVRTFDALLMISRVEAGSSVVALSEVKPVEILTDVHELYEAVAEDEGAKLNLEIECDESLSISANRELVSQALTNLVDNALKYAGNEDASAEITMKLSVADKMCVFEVSDNGPGVAPEDLDRITGRFVRLEKSRSMPGNGLGLSLVKAIASLHDGVLQLANNEPGLKVQLKLPIDKQETG